MGFIGASLNLDIGINSNDRTDAYYLIDGITYDLETQNEQITENIKVTILLNVYNNRNDRLIRENPLESRTYERIVTRSDIDTLSMSDYYIYCKPLIIEELKINLSLKLGNDITDEIPSEYSQYYSLTDHL
jgi:hypothetical protein